jgi:hypothetical protein
MSLVRSAFAIDEPSNGERRATPARATAERNTGPGILEKTIDRLEDILEEETRALRGRRSLDMREFNNRKSQALLELSRVARLLGSGPLDAELQDRLTSLRSKLEVNLGVIRMHLDAVKEIAAVVSGSIQDAQSDGTYSRGARNGPAKA